jgi:hypothetical protein
MELEHQNKEGICVLVEILSNLSFFGELKKNQCPYAKDGQCAYFKLESGTKNKLPIVGDCRIRGCEEPECHCHLELSTITCSVCHKNQ